MAQLTWQQVAQYWVQAGGNPSVLWVALSVARAESGFDTAAISPAGDYGLWQINRINFDVYDLNPVSALDPARNAEVAVKMSADGNNWAAWCTAWADPARDCGHGLLQVPQLGSDAYPYLTQYAAVTPTGVSTPTAQPSQQPIADFNNAWSAVQNFHGPYARGRFAGLASMAQSLKGIVT